MVAAFRDDPQDPQLPFQSWAQPSKRVSPSPSFDYADPVQKVPSVHINPAIRPPLSRGAIAVPNLTPSSQHASGHRPQSKELAQYGAQSHLAYPQSSALQSSSLQLSSQSAAIRPAASQASLPVRAVQSTAPQAAIQPVRSQKLITPLPNPSPYAPWVKWLMVGQKGICLLTLTLVGCALSLYGQSVYQHRQWGQSYNQLEQLQKLEQQGMAASEIMKQSLAEEAERPTSQMSSQMPDTAIPIEIAPAQPVEDTPIPTKSVLDLDSDSPMGY